MDTRVLDYHLPRVRIAERPAEPRESAKLLVYDRATGERRHLSVGDLPEILSASDCLVVNVASVFRARLWGTLARTGRRQELLFLRRQSAARAQDDASATWEALARGSVRPGDSVVLPDHVQATLERETGTGTWRVRLSLAAGDVDSYFARVGHIPVPPYIRREPAPGEYETAYADPRERRSVAAPTAGFHLTAGILAALSARHAQLERVVLDIGLGTFRPITAARLADHRMHTERVEIPEDVAGRIRSATREGKRVVAVGTTTVRALESATDDDGMVAPFSGETALWITPGYRFKIVGALLTNFHLPQSSLLALVAAFIGSVDVTQDLYREAIAREYRFYSFGDAMLIV